MLFSNKYSGDVVRIGPNILVFITPKAAAGKRPHNFLYLVLACQLRQKLTDELDTYIPSVKGLEYFPKADFISLGWPDQGITWETDPVRHHQKAKWLLPAFSAKSLKEKEWVMHKYTDIFVKSMKELGGQDKGIELKQVSLLKSYSSLPADTLYSIM